MWKVKMNNLLNWRYFRSFLYWRNCINKKLYIIRFQNFLWLLIFLKIFKKINIYGSVIIMPINILIFLLFLHTNAESMLFDITLLYSYKIYFFKSNYCTNNYTDINRNFCIFLLLKTGIYYSGNKSLNWKHQLIKKYNTQAYNWEHESVDDLY